MTALATNLIPAPRRAARQARARLRGWFAGWFAILTLGSMGIIAALAARDQGPRASEDEWKALEARHEASQARLTRLKADAARLADRKATLLLIGTHPDWSVVLALVSHRTGAGVSLTSIEILPASAKPGARPAYSVVIDGMAVDQASASSFVLSLERLGVFDEVSLRQSRREGIGDNAPVVFNIACVAEE